MTLRRELHFFVLYSAHHNRCGQFLERADFRVITRDDLIAWSHDIVINGQFGTLPLRCDICSENVQPTHLRIVEDTDPMPRTIVPEVEIARFNPDDWIVGPKQ